MAEDKSKKDLEANQADKEAKKATKTVKKPVIEKSAVTPTAEGDIKGEQDAVQSKSEVAEMTDVVADEPKTAKAGKRSAKAIAEAEEKQAKEERKTAKKDAEEETKPKQVQKVRSKLERRGKGFRKSAELIEAGKAYSLNEALDLATKTSHVKFDATVELHVRLGVDPRQADQNIRDMVVLPSGTGKTIRIAVLADDQGVAEAKKAGADIAGSDEFLQQLDKGTIDFDVLIATPAMMPKLGKYARVLGPKGLMPNPKSGTVTPDVAKAVTEAKAGRVEYRVDSTGIVHIGFGKVSFGKQKLEANARAILASIKGNKPSSLKGGFVKSIYVTTSMGPSINIDSSEL